MDPPSDLFDPGIKAYLEVPDLNQVSAQAAPSLPRVDSDNPVHQGIPDATTAFAEMHYDQGYFPADSGYWPHVPSAPVDGGNRHPQPHPHPQGSSPTHAHATGPPSFSNFNLPYFPQARNEQPYHTMAQAVPPGNPAPSHPPLAHRASGPNSRFAQHAQQGAAVGHGLPPSFPGPLPSNYWQVPQQSFGAPVGMHQTIPSPTFEFSPSPTNLCGGPRQELTLLPPHDNTLMSRVNSYSSVVSSASDSSYYTPMSATGNTDYFSNDRELRSVSSSVAGHYSPGDGPSYESSASLPGTISLARIQEGKPLGKFGSAPSVTESEGGSPAPSFHSSPAHSVKGEYHSPQRHHISSPEDSNGSNLHALPQYSGHFRATDATSSTPELSSSRTTQSPSSPNDSLDDDEAYATQDDRDDEDFRPCPAKRAQRNHKKKSSSCRRRSSASSVSAVPSSSRAQKPNSAKVRDAIVNVNLSLSALLVKYPRLPHDFPLLFHALGHDMVIDDAAAPKIGTIPTTVLPLQKCDFLRDFYHRGRRVIQQLDAFIKLVRPRNNGSRKAQPPWPEITKPYSTAFIAVRRKIVERTENYKYTRRDILRKLHGRCCPANNAQCIMDGLIDWEPESGDNDPAGDLALRGIVVMPGAGCGSPITPATPALAVGSLVTGRQGRREIRPVPSRSSLRTSTRRQPPPISLVPHAPTSSHPPSSLHGSAGAPTHGPITMPPTPVSAVSTDGSLVPLPFNNLAVSSPVSEFNPEAHLADGRMPMSAGPRQTGFGEHMSMSPLPSPSALGLALGPNGRAPPPGYSHHTFQVNKSHSRSYSTDSGHTSSDTDW